MKTRIRELSGVMEIFCILIMLYILQEGMHLSKLIEPYF